MLQRFKEHVSSYIPQEFTDKNSKPSEYEGIIISDKAEHILKRKVDKATRTALLESFRSLEGAYQFPEVTAERLTKEPVLKITRGFTLSPFATIADYTLQRDFNPTEREGGECGDIARWFLYDLQSTGIANALAQRNVSLNIIRGQSPLFFNTENSNHVMVSLEDTKHKWEVLFDPSFGNIVSTDEAGGYHVNSREQISEAEEKGLFESRLQRVYGWEHVLEHGAQAPRTDERESPSVSTLGLSKDGSRCFGVGFETDKDKPFISVTYPQGTRQDIIWQDDDLDTVDNLGFMSSDYGQTATEEYPFNDEVAALLDTLKDFRVEEANINDPRLQEIHF